VHVYVAAGYPLSQFVTYCADHYLTSEHKEVRLEAVKTCSHLLTPSLNVSHFYARQHICYSAYMPWQFRLSVCLSVCPSVTQVDQSKTVEARITQFSPYSSPIPLGFRG